MENGLKIYVSRQTNFDFALFGTWKNFENLCNCDQENCIRFLLFLIYEVKVRENIYNFLEHSWKGLKSISKFKKEFLMRKKSILLVLLELTFLVFFKPLCCYGCWLLSFKEVYCKLFLQLLGITGNRAVITKDLLRHLQCMKSRNESSTRSAAADFSLIDTCFKETKTSFRICVCSALKSKLIKKKKGELRDS